MSAWDVVKGAIKTVAPVLGTALGGPLGGVAASTISNAILGKSDGTPEEVMEALNNQSSEMFYKLKEAEFTFEAKLREIEAKDRVNARAREESYFVKTGKGDPIQAFIAIAVTLGFFGLLFGITFFNISSTADKIAYIMFGGLGTGFACIIQYYFGSSSGSNKKTEMMNKNTGILESILSKTKLF